MRLDEVCNRISTKTDLASKNGYPENKKVNKCRFRGVKPDCLLSIIQSRIPPGLYLQPIRVPSRIQPKALTLQSKWIPLGSNPKFQSAIHRGPPVSTQNSTWRLIPDPIKDLTPIQSKRSYEIMQIIKEKPQIDLVFKLHIQAKRQEIEQKDKSTNAFEIYSCLTEFETANSEKQNSETLETKYLTSINTRALSGNTCKIEESGLNLLKSVEKNSPNLKPELTETGLQIVTGWTAKLCFCPLVREVWN
jgi:hypothetical protein